MGKLRPGARAESLRLTEENTLSISVRHGYSRDGNARRILARTGKPETFTFLGFTHYCGKRRSNGAFIVWRKAAKMRMVAKLHAIKAELRRRMHEPVAEVGAWLRKVVTGYYRYHAIPGNIDRLSVFGQRLRRMWWLILRRRSQSRMSWDRVTRIFPRWIPAPRVLHPYPIARFLATHPRWEPYA